VLASNVGTAVERRPPIDPSFPNAQRSNRGNDMIFDVGTQDLLFVMIFLLLSLTLSI
jgi:hypothetical protein